MALTSQLHHHKCYMRCTVPQLRLTSATATVIGPWLANTLQRLGRLSEKHTQTEPTALHETLLQHRQPPTYKCRLSSSDEPDESANRANCRYLTPSHADLLARVLGPGHGRREKHREKTPSAVKNVSQMTLEENLFALLSYLPSPHRTFLKPTPSFLVWQHTSCLRHEFARCGRGWRWLLLLVVIIILQQ